MSRVAACLAGAVLALPAAGQVIPRAADPGAIQQRQIDEDRRREELERLKRKPVTDPLRVPDTGKPAVQAAPDAVRFQVREIEFTASEILTREELESIARDYRGRELTFADLQQLAERVNALYRAKGVVTAQAVVPPQDVSAGIVRIRLVEGRLGEIRLDGNENTSERFVKWRLGQEPGQLVDLQLLERSLVRFNRTSDAQLRADLKPGATFGTTDLNLTLTEPPRQDLRAFIDNNGATGTGVWRVGVSYLNRSLLGYRDDLSLGANASDGHEGYSIVYGFPWNRWGGRASLGYYKDYTEITEGAAAVLDITGESEAQILTLRQPLYVGDTVQFDLTAGAKKRTSSNWISGLLLQSTRTEDGNVGAELQVLDRSGFWLATYSITSGRARVFADSDNYTIGRGFLRRVNDFGKGWSGRGTVSFQNSSDVLLPSSEQFFIGGEGSVRGYPVGVYSGDQGYTVNLEVHRALGSFGGEGVMELNASVFGFLDQGYVEPFRPPNSVLRSYERISSGGIGVNAQLGKRVSARLTYAYAFNNIPLESRRYDVLFQLIASLY